jgi:hypothetical protein
MPRHNKTSPYASKHGHKKAPVAGDPAQSTTSAGYEGSGTAPGDPADGVRAASVPDNSGNARTGRIDGEPARQVADDPDADTTDGGDGTYPPGEGATPNDGSAGQSDDPNVKATKKEPGGAIGS